MRYIHIHLCICLLALTNSPHLFFDSLLFLPRIFESTGVDNMVLGDSVDSITNYLKGYGVLFYILWIIFGWIISVSAFFRQASAFFG